MTATDRFIKPEAVCELLGISRNTLCRLLAEKQIAGYKVGGQWRFAQADIDTYIQRCRVSAAPTVRIAPQAPKRGRPPKGGYRYVPGMKVV